MAWTTTLFLVIGVPLILMSLGFVFLSLKISRSRLNEAELAKIQQEIQFIQISLERLNQRLEIMEQLAAENLNPEDD
ncbi:MAG: hypothetical protein LBK52_04240 [Deltaproteobacteria bacterium]|jgi:hypothetical protein|nr:hypothetical protein [Deltaproteobacteria bacterium]